MVNFGILAAELVSLVWGTPLRFLFGQPERRSGSFLYKNSSQQCIRKCYLNSGGLQKPDDLAELQAAIETIPVTSADTERGFSTMNIIASPIGNQLSVERLSKLMFASLIGPPLESFNALTYVSGWQVLHRGANDNQTRKRQPKEDLRYSHIHKIFA